MELREGALRGFPAAFVLLGERLSRVWMDAPLHASTPYDTFVAIRSGDPIRLPFRQGTVREPGRRRPRGPRAPLVITGDAVTNVVGVLDRGTRCSDGRKGAMMLAQT